MTIRKLAFSVSLVEIAVRTMATQRLRIFEIALPRIK